MPFIKNFEKIYEIHCNLFYKLFAKLVHIDLSFALIQLYLFIILIYFRYQIIL